MPQNEFKPVTLSQLIDTLYGSIANFVTPSGKRAESEFVTYVAPTIPLTDDDLFFLVGDIPNGSDEQGGSNARVDAFEKRRESAYYFAELVNFVPSVEPNTVMVTNVDEGEAETLAGARGLKSFEEFRTKGQSLDDIFFEVVNSARVLDRPRSPEEQERIDKLRALLEVSPEEEITDEDVAPADPDDDPLADIDDGLGDLDDLGLDDLDDLDLEEIDGGAFLEGGDPPEPTKLMQRYNYFRNLFENAEAAMVQKLIDIEENPANARFRAKLLAIEKKKLRRILQLWNTVGRRGQVNKIFNIINALEQGGMVEYRARLQEAMDNARFDVDLIADATTTQHFTSITPANLFKSEQWQTFDLDNESTFNSYERESKSFSGKIGFALPFGLMVGAKGSTSKTEIEQEKFSEKVSISFQIAQGILVRPWFDAPFLMCRKYTMSDPATGESLAALEDDDFVLSDGGRPPKGILPAYTTSVVFVRNLTIRSEQILDYVEKLRESSSGGAGVTLLGFPLSARGKMSKSKTENLVTTDRSTGEITIGGTHIVAFRGTYLDKAPNPDFQEHSDPTHWV